MNVITYTGLITELQKIAQDPFAGVPEFTGPGMAFKKQFDPEKAKDRVAKAAKKFEADRAPRMKTQMEEGLENTTVRPDTSQQRIGTKITPQQPPPIKSQASMPWNRGDSGVHPGTPMATAHTPPAAVGHAAPAVMTAEHAPVSRMRSMMATRAGKVGAGAAAALGVGALGYGIGKMRAHSQQKQKTSANWKAIGEAAGHAAEVGGLGVLAAPTIQKMRGKKMSERGEHAAELGGLGILAVPSAVHLGRMAFHKGASVTAGALSIFRK